MEQIERFASSNPSYMVTNNVKKKKKNLMRAQNWSQKSWFPRVICSCCHEDNDNEDCFDGCEAVDENQHTLELDFIHLTNARHTAGFGSYCKVLFWFWSKSHYSPFFFLKKKKVIIRVLDQTSQKKNCISYYHRGQNFGLLLLLLIKYFKITTYFILSYLKNYKSVKLFYI